MSSLHKRLTAQEIDSIINYCCIKLQCENTFTWKWNSRFRTKLGLAYTTLGRMEFSTFLFERVDSAAQTNTVVHETCHLIAWKLYKDGGHGKYWKWCMRRLGYEPKRCHSFDFREHKHHIECACGKRPIGPLRYKRMLNGVKYSCSICREVVKPIGV